MLVGRMVDPPYARHARERRGCGAYRCAIRREHSHCHPYLFLGRLLLGRTPDRVSTGDALGGAGIELGAVMLGNDQYFGSHKSPFFFSASTSSRASFTFVPFWRTCGGSQRTILTWGVGVMPRSAKDRVSSGFLLAFMMSGSCT